MAEPVYIRCPECRKRFKGRREQDGKRIRCPSCEEPFVLDLDEDEVDPPGEKRKKPQEKASRQAKTEPSKPAPPPPPPPVETAITAPPPDDEGDEFDDDGNPYKIENVDVKARCPNCAKEMLSEKAIICVYCGYNTLTREIGKTKKTYEVSGKEHFMHLLPGLGAVAFIIFQTVGVLSYCLILPNASPGSYFDSEAMRLWTTIPALMDTWPVAVYAYNRLVLHPKPEERKKDD